MNRRTFFAASAGAIAGAALPAAAECQHKMGLDTQVCEKCGETAERLYVSQPNGPVMFTYNNYTFEAKRGAITQFRARNGTVFTILLQS